MIIFKFMGRARTETSNQEQSLVTVCVECLFLRTPSRAPYRSPSACAKGDLPVTVTGSFVIGTAVINTHTGQSPGLSPGPY